MYQFKPQQLSQFHPISKKIQDEITKQSGTPLDLENAFDLIKKASDDFSKEDPLALETDGLLIELLELQKKANSKSQIPNDNLDSHRDQKTISLSKAAVEIREKERLRAIALIELELSLNLKSA